MRQVHRRRGAAVAGLLFAVAATCAAAQDKLPLGAASGSYRSMVQERNVAAADFDEALAYRRYDNGERQTVILLSDGPLEEPKVQDDAYLEQRAREGVMTVLQIRLANANGRVLSHVLFDGNGRTELSSPGTVDWKKTTFVSTRIEGQVTYAAQGEGAAGAPARSYEVMFNARVRQGPWVEPGEVSGTLRLGETYHELRHVRLEATSDAVTVVLASDDLPPAESVAAMAAAATARGAGVLVTTIARKTGKVVEAQCMGKGVDGPNVAAGVDWNREDWNRRVMRGRIDTESLKGSPPCIVEAYFAATPP